MATKTEIVKLYVATFNRAADADGLNYWISDGTANTTILTDIEDIATGMLASPEASALYAGEDREAMIIDMYSNLFNRTVDATDAGVQYWATGEGSSIPENKMIIALINGAKDDDATILDNKAEVGEYFANKGYNDIEAAKKVMDGVTANKATVDAAILEIAALPKEATEATEATGTTGDTLSLNVTADHITGTDANDTIYADIQQNAEGAIANALSTGDVIDGGAGSDILKTTMMNDTVTNNGASVEHFDPMPRLNSVETIEVEALGSAAVTIDAGKMVGTNNYTSFESRQDLTFNDIRIEDNQVTSDLTFRLDGTDHSTAFTAQLDSESFRASSSTQVNSQMRIDLMDLGTEENPYDDAAPLGQLNVNGIKFTIDGVAKEVKSDAIDAAKTYAELKDAIQSALAEAAKTDDSIAGLTVSLKEDNFTTTGFGDHKGDSVIITDANGRALDGTGFVQDGETSEFTLYGRFVEQDPTQVDNLITTNLELDNAGRNSTTGAVAINSMSNSAEGVQVINVKVDEDSAIAGLTTNLGYAKNADGTVNHGLQKIVITSLDQKGDLEIGALNDNIVTIDASDFKGDNLMLGSTVEVGNTTDHNIIDLTTLSANIAANVTFDGAITENTEGDTNTAYAYTTGSGKDTVNVALDGDAVDADGESFTVSTNGDDDTVSLTMTAGVSQDTMNTLNNLDVMTGSGNDTVTIGGYGNWDIATSTGDDYIRIDSSVGAGTGTVGTAVVIGDQSDTTNNFFNERVLYNAELTVSFAGIEEKVTVKTDDNFVATQKDINDAIKEAISNNTELTKLLTVSDSTGNDSMTITSTIDGANSFAIALYQPTLVDGSTAVTEGQTQLALADLTALRQGIIDTTTASSDDLNATTVATFITEMDTAPVYNSLFDGSIQADGTTDGKTYVYNEHDVVVGDASVKDTEDADIFDDSTTYINYTTLGTEDTAEINLSTINAGAGNDLIVLHSNDASSNIVKIDGSFGTTTVVNFHDEATADVDGPEDVGAHALEFTFLDGKVDASSALSGNTQSTADLSITTNIVADAEAFDTVSVGKTNNNHAEANSVNVIRFNEESTGEDTFANLTADIVKASLNGDYSVSGDTQYGNLSNTLLSPVTNADLTTNTQKHIIMIENDLNEGEYKVFEATSTLTGTAGAKTLVQNADNEDVFATVKEIGTLDFGASINVNVAGNVTYENYREAFIEAASTGATTFTYDVETGAGIQGSGTTPTIVNPTQANGGTYTLAEYSAIINDGLTPTTYSLSDTAANLVAAAGDTLNNATNLTVTGTATVAQMSTIIAATNSGTETYSLNDTAANLATGVATMNTAVNVTSSDDATVARAEIIADATNSGTTSYNIADSVANVKAGVALGVAANKDGLADAGTITMNAVASAAAEVVTFNNLNANTAATTVDFVDAAVVLTVAELTALNVTTTTLDLTASDNITVNAAALTTDFTAATVVTAASSLLIDTIDMSNGNATITLTAAQANAVDVSGEDASDSVTIDTLNGATVAATDAIDTFVFANGDTGIAITGFNSGSADLLNIDNVTDAALAGSAYVSWDEDAAVADNSVLLINANNGVMSTSDIQALLTDTDVDGDGKMQVATADQVIIFNQYGTNDVTTQIFAVTGVNGDDTVSLVGTVTADAAIVWADLA